MCQGLREERANEMMMMMRAAMATLSLSPPHQWNASCCRPHSFLARNPNPFPWNPLVPSKRRSRGGSRPHQRGRCLCLASFGFIDRLDSLGFEPGAVKAALEHAETLLYSLADSVVSADVVETQKQGGDWLSGLTNGMESILKILKDTLSSLHVPYSYGFAIILLTVLVKVATLPLTKKQVESTLAMQNLSPKIKTIQQQYKGDQERIQLETARLYKEAGVNPLAGCLPTLITIPIWIGLYRALSNVANEGLLTEGFFWIPSLAGPTTVAARQSGSGISWLFPFVDGHPPLGWSDTLAYLVLPALLITSQYVSMQIMQTPQTNDPSQKNSQLILKFLPLMIGYFSLSVPSGLSLYWLTNNILSTGQQVWLKKLGGAKVAIGKDDSDITMSARQSLRSAAVATPVMDPKEKERGERFKLLKEKEARKKAKQAEAAKKAAEEADIKVAITSKDEEGKDSLDERHSKNGNGAASQDGLEPKESTASKQKTP